MGVETTSWRDGAMPTLSVFARDFGGSFARLNRMHQLDVTEDQVLKFAMTMGLPALAVASPTLQHAVTLACYKMLAIKCAIDFTGSELARPSEYDDMDATEKANISYWTGMTLASLVADELLGVAQLTHAESLRKMGFLTGTRTSRSLADLVGSDNGGAMHVVEAKARQGGVSQQVHGRWKAQARSVASVQGQPPATNSYAFTRVGTPYSVELVDPPAEKEPQSVSYMLTDGAVVSGYYGPIMGWLAETQAAQRARSHREGHALILQRAAFDAVSNNFVFFGMTAEAFEQVQANVVPDRRQPMKLADGYLGSDGVVIVTSPNPDLT